jgi:hypothetical protein
MNKYHLHHPPILVLLIALLFVAKVSSAKVNPIDDPFEPVYGITVDDSWSGETKLNQILDAIKAMPVKPTVRIVMSDKISPQEYVPLFQKIHKVAYVMAEPVDSYYMKGYQSVEQYLQRFKDSYQHLSPYVDLWEIANEINGEGWLGGDRQFNADKMYAAYTFIKEKKGKTVLTSYEVAPGDQEMSMREWLLKYVPDDMKKGLDYMIVSYYEDDHHGYQPDWKAVFGYLQEMFPAARLAIGECGNTAKDATLESKARMARSYYTMPRYVKNFVGGYFWWMWVQDCTPHKDNVVWDAISESIKRQNGKW